MTEIVSQYERSRPLETVQQGVDLVDAFDAACRLAGLSHKQVAALMDVSASQLSAMLRQERPLSIVRLLKLKDDVDGRRFLRCYMPLMAEAMGLPEFSHGLRVAEALMQFVDNTQKRMARCDIAVREAWDGTERRRA